MIAAIIIYWIVAGLAMYLALPPMPPKYSNEFTFVVSMIIGGIFVPARLIAKVLS